MPIFTYALLLFSTLSVLQRFSASAAQRQKYIIPHGCFLFQALIGLILSDMSVLRPVSRGTGHHHTNPRKIHSRLRFGQGWVNIMFL